MIVIARKYGQLGNRLFLFAHVIAAARHYGVELRNPCFAEYADLFPSTQTDLWCRYDSHLGADSDRDRPAESRQSTRETIGDHPLPSKRSRLALMNSVQVAAKTLNTLGLRDYPAKVIRLKGEEECDLQGDRFREAIQSKRTILLQGWMFRSGQLLNDHWASIKDYFALGHDDRSVVDTTIRSARSNSDVLIGVHIRRGDYATFMDGQYYFDDDVYARWMNDVCDQLPGRRVRFMVCSHEQLDQSKFAGLRITRGPGSALQDMYALAETDWMIGPPSTFTAWASYIGRKPRIELDSKDAKVACPAVDRIDLPSQLKSPLQSDQVRLQTASPIGQR